MGEDTKTGMKGHSTYILIEDFDNEYCLVKEDFVTFIKPMFKPDDGKFMGYELALKHGIARDFGRNKWSVVARHFIAIGPLIELLEKHPEINER